MKLLLRDTNPEVVKTLKAAFRDFQNVNVKCGDILSEKADAIVSPSNSFGFFDGGLNEALGIHFTGIEGRVREHLRVNYSGELLVGQATFLPTGDDDIKFLIVAPTMRCPMRIPPINVYLAARVVFLLCKQFTLPRQTEIDGTPATVHEHLFKTVLMPGMGTGCGMVSPADAAQSMRHAYQHTFETYDKALNPPRYPLPNSWKEAVEWTRLGIG